MRHYISPPSRPQAGHDSARRLGAAAFALVASLALLFAAAAAGAATKDTPPASYRLGIFPYLAPRQTVEFFGPVAANMERALSHPVKLESVPTFGDFTAAMARETYDIALIQPFDYPEVVEKNGYVPLAQLSVPLVSQFYVRGDSRYQKLEDLRGTTIAMPPAESASARMVLRALYDNNLIPGRDVELRYFNSHDSCIQQVWVGSASACGTARPVVLVFEQRMHASLRPIYSTPSLPHILFVAHPRVPAEQRAKLQELIIGWSRSEEGRAILKSLGFPGYVPPRPAEYAILRNYDPSAPIASAKQKASKDLVLGVFPYLAPRQLAQNVAPLLPALRGAANANVHLRTASSFGSFMDGVAAGSYDVILAQPFQYARATRSGYLPLAGMKDPLKGGFFVREQSVYRQMADFKGQTIAMPPVDSAQAHLGRQALARAGLAPGRDVTLNYRPTHDSCLREVQRGAAAACATAPLALKMLPEELTRNLRAVGQTEKVPGVLFLAHKRLPDKLRDRLQAEILSWKDSEAGRKILQSLGFGEFAPVVPADYQNLPDLKVLR